MDRDRNLLFGVFAVQLRKVTPSQIMEAAAAWAVDTSKDLPDRLLEDGALSPTDRTFLANLVEQAIADHDGDATATLQTLGGAAQVERSFYGSVMIKPDGGVETVIADPSASDTQSLGVEEAPGRYSQVGETARGGMGRILLVHDEFLGRDVALKELLPGLVPSSGAPAQKLSPAREGMSLMARFLQEARITGQLEHPSIVPVYELGHRPDGTIYYTMKLVRGETLEDAIAKARNLQERLGLLNHFIDLCQGIAYAHSLNVIHRDIKPSNVMVGKFGETVVLDWGLAKVKDREDVHSEEIKETLRMMNLGDAEALGKTAYGEVMGTPLYMPPEQAKGQLDQVDERSDVYSLGAVLYELLTGRPPFDPAPPKLILEKAVREKPRPIRELVPDASPELAAICEKALAKDPSKRYDSAKNLAKEIQRFQSGALVHAHEYTTTQLARRFVRQHRMKVVGASALIIMLIASASVYIWMRNRAVMQIEYTNQILRESWENEVALRELAESAQDDAEKARDAEAEQRESADQARQRAEDALKTAETRAYEAQILIAQSQIEDGDFESARQSLAKTVPEQRGWEWGYFQNLCNLDLLTVECQGGYDAFHAMFRPDGKEFMAVHYNGVDFYDVETRKKVKTLPASSLQWAQYSSDGKWIAGPTTTRQGEIWDVESEQKIYATPRQSGYVDRSHLTPDGKYLITATDQASPYGRIQIWNVASEQQVAALDANLSNTNVADRRRVLSRDGSMLLASERGKPEAIIVSVATGEVLHRLPGGFHDSFDSVGRYLVTNASETVYVWEVDSWSQVLKIEDAYRPHISADGTRILAYRKGNWITIEVPSGEVLAEETGTTDGYIHAITRDGDRFFTSDEHHVLTLRDTNSGTPIRIYTGHSQGFNDIELSPSGEYLLTSSEDGTAKVWRTETQTEVFTYSGHAYPANSVLWSDDSKLLASSGTEGTTRIWDVETRREIVALSALGQSTVSAAFHPSRPSLYTLSTSGLIARWGMDPPEFHSAIQTDVSFGRRLVLSPNADVLVAVGKNLLVYDADTLASLRDLSHEDLYFVDAQFNPSGDRLVAASSWENTVVVFDAVTGEEVQRYTYDESVSSVCVSPDGSKIVVGHLAGAATITDLPSGTMISQLEGHSDWIGGISYFPDGHRIVTSGDNRDRNLRVFHADSAALLAVLKDSASGSNVVSPALPSPNGSFLASATGNGFKIWGSIAANDGIWALESFDDIQARMSGIKAEHGQNSRSSNQKESPSHLAFGTRQELVQMLIDTADWIDGIPEFLDGNTYYKTREQFEEELSANRGISATAVRTACDGKLPMLNWGTIIEVIDNEPVKLNASSAELLRKLARKFANTDERAVTFLYRDGESSRELNLTILDSETKYVELTLPRNVDRTLQILVRKVEIEEKKVKEAGQPVNLNSFPVEELPKRLEDALVEAGAGEYDRISAIDSERFSDMAGFVSLLKKTLTRLEKEEAPVTEISVERGPLETLVFRISYEDD